MNVPLLLELVPRDAEVHPPVGPLYALIGVSVVLMTTLCVTQITIKIDRILGLRAGMVASVLMKNLPCAVTGRQEVLAMHMLVPIRMARICIPEPLTGEIVSAQAGKAHSLLIWEVIVMHSPAEGC